MNVPERRFVASFMEKSRALVNRERDDFHTLLNEGMRLFGVSVEAFAKELGILPFTLENWRSKKSIPLAGMQQIAIGRLCARAPAYENHYDIVWAKYFLPHNGGKATYWHSPWMISYVATPAWSLGGEECWQLIDINEGVLLESSMIRLLFACAREKILDKASATLTEFEFEVP